MAHQIYKPIPATGEYHVNANNRLTFHPTGWERVVSDKKTLFFPLSNKAMYSLIATVGSKLAAKKNAIIQQTNYKIHKLQKLSGQTSYFKNFPLGGGQYASLKTFTTPQRPSHFAVSFWLTNQPFTRSDITKPCGRNFSLKSEELDLCLADAGLILRKLRKNLSPMRRRSVLSGSDKENAESTKRGRKRGFHSTPRSSQSSSRQAFQSPPPVSRSNR